MNRTLPIALLALASLGGGCSIDNREETSAFSVGYRTRFLGDKVRANVQLNVKDVFENGRLQAVAANPDGSIYAWRIKEPRQFILTVGFDL